MALPNRSVRIDPAHGDVLNDLLDLLRAGRADDVRMALRRLRAEGDQRPVGPFRSAQAALDFLIGRIVVATHPQAIWLFGSRARGDAQADSDFDLMAVFPDDDPTDIDTRRRQMAEAVAASGVGADVAACAAAEFKACRSTAGSLIRTVHEQGREVYVSRAERKRRRQAAAA